MKSPMEVAHMEAYAKPLLEALGSQIKTQFGCGDPNCDVCEPCRIARDVADKSSIIRQQAAVMFATGRSKL